MHGPLPNPQNPPKIPAFSLHFCLFPRRMAKVQGLANFVASCVIILIGCVFLLVVPKFLYRSEWGHEQVTNEGAYKELGTMYKGRSTAVNKMARVVINARVSLKEIKDLISKFSMASYPDKQSVLSGTRKLRIQWTIPNAITLIGSHMFLCKQQNLRCETFECKTITGGSAMLGAVIVVIALGAAVHFYLVVCRGIATLCCFWFRPKSKTQKNYQSKATIENALMMMLTLTMAGLMFGMAVWASMRENSWTWKDSVEYVFHIASGVGGIYGVPSYIRDNQVTWMLAGYTIAMFLWMTTPMVALCYSGVRLGQHLGRTMHGQKTAAELRKKVKLEEQIKLQMGAKPMYHS